MSTTVVKVQGMNGRRSASAIEIALIDVPGVRSATAEIGGDTVVIEHDPFVSSGAFFEVISEAGYQPKACFSRI
jgi:copper chaperone CopZ